ncbi:class I tRNA ligase family protein, partial [Photobacterium sp. OFAV2-7]|uniref:class I tRNA ligase family protein n=1 Tax=Photobacterium sp. OFAV2-7 TaxID=2917748 RepID=UPI001EF51068
LKYFDGQLEEAIKHSLDDECEQLLASCQPELERTIHCYKKYDLYQATLILKQILDQLNTFFHHRTPWLISKGQDSQHVKNTCFVVSNILRQVVLSYAPITPKLSDSVLAEFGIDTSECLLRSSIELSAINISQANSHFERIQLSN